MPDAAIRAAGVIAKGNQVTLNVAIPAAAQIGDLLVLTGCSSGAALPTIAGWTLRGGGVVGTSNQLTMGVWTRVCQPGDQSTTVAWTDAAAVRKVAIINAWMNQDDAHPIDAVSALLADVTSGARTRSLASASRVQRSTAFALVGDRASGTVPPNDGFASSAFTYPAGFTDLVHDRSDVTQNKGDCSMGLAIGPAADSGTVGGGFWTADMANARGGSVVWAVRSAAKVYPRIMALQDGVWHLCNIIGIGEGGALKDVALVDTTPYSTPSLTADFNDGAIPTWFSPVIGATVDPAYGYSGMGCRLTPRPGDSICTLTSQDPRFPGGHPWTSFRLRFRLVTAIPADQQFVVLFEIGNNVATTPKSQFTCFFGEGSIKADFGAPFERITLGPMPALDVWHQLEVRIFYGSTFYQAYLRYDGGTTHTITSRRNKVPTTSRALWLHYPSDPTIYVCDVDDIALLTADGDPGWLR